MKKKKQTFKKNDSGKLRPDLIPTEYLVGLAEVLTIGAVNYGENNWKNCEDPTRYVAAAWRHWLAYLGGEKNDPETGMSHLFHLGCCIAFLHGITEGKDA